jgi:tetratricopeptide (TPR) repeat protein
MRIVAFLLVLLLSGGATSLAQHEHHQHGEHAENFGAVEFPITCNQAAQDRFIRALAMLHSFAYGAAEKEFNAAAAADPRCGMAYWGVAMSNYHPIWAPPTPDELQRGRTAAQKAKSLGARTARERAFINAVAEFYRDAGKRDHPTRAGAFRQAMEKVASQFPDDDEASIFYALTLLSHGMSMPGDKTYANQKKAAEILNRVLSRHERHPGVSHYIIHSFDYPALAQLAVPAAQVYAKLAPDSPHAQHMPSHIFVRLGMWQETIDSNLVSASTARRLTDRMFPGTTAFDELHAIDYLAYAYLQRGEDEAVRELIERVEAVSKLDVPNFAAAFALGAVPARYALERRRWSEAAALMPHPAYPWEKIPYAEANIVFARAVGNARSGNVEAARADVSRLESLRDGLRAKKDNFWADHVEIQRLGAAAWLARSEGRDDEAKKLMRAAAELEDSTEKHPVTPGSILPAREMLADLLLELNKPQKALAEYEASLKTAPNRLNSLSGAARAAQLAGDRQKAESYYRQLAALYEQRGAPERVATR